MKLDKFWDISSRWYFFLILHLLCMLVLALYFTFAESGAFEIKQVGTAALFYLGLWPLGVLASISLVVSLFGPDAMAFVEVLFDHSEEAAISIIVLFHVLLYGSVIAIDIYRRRGRILRWLIIAAILVILLALPGCMYIAHDIVNASW